MIITIVKIKKMKDVKIKILFFVFFTLSIIQQFAKNSHFDDYISYIQTGILIVLTVILIKRIIANFKDKSKTSKEKYSMIINMVMLIILLILGYFIINNTLKP